MTGDHKELQDVYHAFDTWHKSKNIAKALHKKAKMKGNEKLKPWIEDIVNHFWYSSEKCDGNLDKLKVFLKICPSLLYQSFDRVSLF